MSTEQETLQAFLEEVMRIQRKYANEQRGVQTNRQSDMKETLERFYAAESDDENN